MKFLSLLLLFSLSGAYAAEKKPTVCTMGSYQYIGIYYSSTYNMNFEYGVETCKKRKDFDEEVIKAEYNDNLMNIEAIIDVLLAEPKCVGLKQILEEYRRRLKQHNDEHDAKVKFDSDYLKIYFSQADPQRQFGHVAAYSSTCNGGHHRGTSFIDLDMLNKIHANTITTQVTQDGQVVDKCGDVRASGDADLKGFEISMKNAKGTDFLFSFDAYGIPDQLMLMGDGGEILFDSGCNPDKTQFMNMTLPLSKVALAKRVKINIVNNCFTPEAERKGDYSSWEFQLKCKEDVPPDPCQEGKEMLIGFVLKKIEQTKTLSNAIALHKQCFTFFDEDVLKELEKGGVVVNEDKPKSNGMCEHMDILCKTDQDKKNKDKNKGP